MLRCLIKENMKNFAEAKRVLPIIEHEISILADLYFKAKDAETVEPDDVEEREGQLESRVWRWREIYEIIKNAPKQAIEECFTCEGENGLPATRSVRICETCAGEDE